MSHVFIEEINGAPAPLAACAGVADMPHCVLLESSSDTGGGGRYSFVSADPFEIFSEPGRPRPDAEDPFARLARRLAAHRVATVAGLPPFQGGAIGYMGYELGGWLERLPAPRADDLGLADMWLGLYDWTLAWDHGSGRAWLVSTGLPERGAAGALRARRRGELVLARLAAAAEASGAAGFPYEPTGHVRGARSDRVYRRGLPGHGSDSPARAPTWPVPGLAGVSSTFTRAGYLAAVERVRRHILEGDIFQANLTQRLQATVPVDALALYGRLRANNPSPFAAYLELGEAAIVSGSPERFLRVLGGRVEARPIKGTAPRGRTSEEDVTRARELLASEKDRAENIMIVDLLRNDLSRTCADGSVRVDRLCALESHPSVHHLVSVVSGELRDGNSALDVLRAAFPCGSITGAPKPRAMEILRELEPTPRGVYTGAIGYVGFDGAMDTSVAIRTFVVKGGTAYFGAGGAIVLESDPEAEYYETLAKAGGMVAALGATETPWTMAAAGERPGSGPVAARESPAAGRG